MSREKLAKDTGDEESESIVGSKRGVERMLKTWPF
jgi:hypothetical protein